MIEKLKGFLRRDVVSSLGHGVVAAALVVVGSWVVPWLSPLSGTVGIGFGLGVALGIYAHREIENARQLIPLQTTTTGKLLKAMDGFLDWMFPLVFGVLTAFLLS